MGERHGEGADRKGSGGHATEKSRPSRHRGCSGLERLPCPRGHPSFGTSKQLTCFGCSGVLCKMTSKKKKGFRISAWALNICKDSETHLQHRVGFPGSEGPTWPGEGAGWGLTQSREWPFSSQLLRDDTDNTISWRRQGVALLSGAGAALPPGCPSPRSPSKPSSEA